MNQSDEKTKILPDEDSGFIRDFLAGDHHAFDQLVLKYKNTVFNVCFRMLGNLNDADDCAQEVFIKVYRGLKDFQFRSSFTTWLYRIAVNTCKNKMASREYRSRERMFELDKPLVSEEGAFMAEIGDESTSPAAAFEKKETGELILKAIDSLPRLQKVLVVLCDIEEKSYEEIVKITGMKLGTVKSKLARARHLLRSKLEGALK
jgi:RNA polymerase sigma-70 factor, ECF subfamily